MPTKRTAKLTRSQRVIKFLRPTSGPKAMLLFIAAFALVGGSYKAYQSFAATDNPYTCATQTTLKVGSKDADQAGSKCVSRVQWYLKNKANYQEGVIDGKYQANTETGVKNLQAWVGLPADGIVNAATWNVFNTMEGTSTTPDPNSGKPGRIQGKRVAVSHADQFSVGGKAVGTVTIDTVTRADNPYTISVTYGRHWVSAEAPAGWKVVGYSACINSTSCHGTITPGNTAAVDVPSNGYVDLWWHYEYAPTATATKPTYAPGLPQSEVKDHTCLVPNSSGTTPCTAAEYNAQTTFLKAAAEATTCISPNQTTYTCTTAEHDKQKAFLVALTTCLAPTPTNAYATRSCTVEEHNKQVADLQKLAEAAKRASTVPAAPPQPNGDQILCLDPTPHNAYNTRPCTKAEYDKQVRDLYNLAHPPAPKAIPSLPGYLPGNNLCGVLVTKTNILGPVIDGNTDLAVRYTSYTGCLDMYNWFKAQSTMRVRSVQYGRTELCFGDSHQRKLNVKACY